MQAPAPLSKQLPHDGGAVRVGGKGLFWSRFPSPGWRCSPILPRHPGRALLQPKQGRSSNPLWVGSSGRSRVSLSRLPALIIPRELVAVASPPPAPQAPSPAMCVSQCTALPGPCWDPCPKPPRAVDLGSSIRGSQGLGKGSNTIKRGTECCSIARCRSLISLLLQIIRSCDCLIDHMIV